MTSENTAAFAIEPRFVKVTVWGWDKPSKGTTGFQRQIFVLATPENALSPESVYKAILEKFGGEAPTTETIQTIPFTAVRTKRAYRKTGKYSKHRKHGFRGNRWVDANGKRKEYGHRQIKAIAATVPAPEAVTTSR